MEDRWYKNGLINEVSFRAFIDVATQSDARPTAAATPGRSSGGPHGPMGRSQA